MGSNRTGIKASPVDSKKTIEGAVAGTPDQRAQLDGAALQAMRRDMSVSAEPVGSMPPPATLKGAAKTAIKALQGEHANVFLDQLGARLAFERTGVRLYEALLIKLEGAHVHEGGPTREDLEEIRDEELEHMHLVRRAMERMGADPTAMTPMADIQAAESMGILKVLTDPRTTLTQALDAILVAELADTDSWTMLCAMAEKLDQDDLAEEFRQALAEEQDHVARVRQWVSAALLGQAGVKPTAAQQVPP
ncbi:MAG TPA: ferritin-like domain-containing protein, partial [Kofleriaceae bacterium]|nr:ferritin-like domain-containing protein [Kofleriaceae bacterium]